MKFSWTVSGAAIIAGVGVVAPWILVFPLEFPASPNHWAAFGGYVGGTLSPIIATLALIAFLRTLSQQQLQIEALNSQSAKSDLLTVIGKIEQDFEERLSAHPIVVHLNGKRYEYSGLDVVTRLVFPGWEKAMVNQEDVENLVAQHGELPMDDQNLHALEMFSTAAGNLNQLRLYVEKHDELSGNNALTKYYQRKYKLAYDRFVTRNILSEGWTIQTTDNKSVDPMR